MNLDVCVPVHDPDGTQGKYIEFLLLTVSQQTKPPTKVFLTANHAIRNFKKLREEYSKAFKLCFVLNSAEGISENLNHAVSLGESEIIKIMFQDDFLLDPFLFQELSQAFADEGVVWSCAPSKNYSQEEMRFTKNLVPSLKKSLLQGINTIGSPSVLSFRKDSWSPADENLKWMLDCDLYFSFGMKFGHPHVTKKHSVASRIHKNQSTNWASIYHDRELEYLKEKYRSLIGKNFPIHPVNRHHEKRNESKN